MNQRDRLLCFDEGYISRKVAAFIILGFSIEDSRKSLSPVRKRSTCSFTKFTPRKPTTLVVG